MILEQHTVELYCDVKHCVHTLKLRNVTLQQALQYAKNHGWEIIAKGGTFCPMCKEKNK